MQENNEIKYLKLEDIIPNRLQPRADFDEEKLNELATSIKQYGIINPLLVRQVGNKYEIIAGERRYKAAKIAGLTKVPVIINNMDDITSAEVAVIENIQRQDLSALEEAKSYRKLLDVGNITQGQLANRIGKNQSTIANKMRLLNLCDEVQEALEKNQISERHARSLLQLKNIDDQRDLLEQIIKERLTVKATENLIKEKLQSIPINSNKNVIEESPSPLSINSINKKIDSIYGNDIVSITELNQKEIEKEDDNMNNNEQNIQMNQGVPANPQTPNQNSEAMAFGSRFFPSLEDQEVNINLNNPFSQGTNSNPQSVQQPMMENLIDTPPVTQTITPEPAIPTFITDNNGPLPTINEPTFAQSNVNIPPQVNSEPIIPNPIMSTPQPEITQNIPINNIVAEPIINPMMNPEPPIAPTIPQSPLPEQQPISTMDSFNRSDIPTPIPNPIPEPTIPDFTMNNPQPTAGAIEPIPTPEVAETVVQKNTDNIINAINAIKNLGLSIESIGYKTTIQEEDTPNTYKITIELEK